jgi:cell division protein FtsB
MASNALCGFMKLSKDNITEAVGLMGKRIRGSGDKTEMATLLYDSMVAMGKENKKLKNEIENLEREIANMQD